MILRPRRTGTYWQVEEAAGFVAMQQVVISSVTNGGTYLRLNLTDPNGSADQFEYTYVVQRSVDGGPFSEVWSNQTGGVSSTIDDHVMFILGVPFRVPSMNGAVFSASATEAMFITAPDTPLFNPLTSDMAASVLFDVQVLTADGHFQLIPAGTQIVIPSGTVAPTTIATPLGHFYSYKITAINKYQSAPISAAQSLMVNSAFSAQNITSVQRIPAGSNKIVLAWTDANSYSPGNIVELWKDVNGAGYSLLATFVKTAAPIPLAYTDAYDYLTLAPATYSYKLRSRSLVPRDTGPFSNVGSIVISFSISQLNMVSTTWVNAGRIDLVWTDTNAPSSESGIRIERQAGSGVFKLIATVAPGTLTYSDLFSTEPGQTYTYRVTAFNALHATASSPIIAGAKATAPMATPVVTSITQVADTGATVSWSDANHYQANYDIQKNVNGGGWVAVATVAGSVASYTDLFALNIGDNIQYRVRATNTNSTGAYSTPLALNIHQTLAAPTSVLVTVVDQFTTKIAWDSTNAGNRGVKLYKSIGGASFVGTPYVILPKDARSYIDALPLAPLIPGQTCSYKVHDFNNQEDGPDSVIGTVIDPYRGPQSLQVAGVVGGVATITWVDNSVPFDYTEIEMAFGSGPFSSVGRVAIGTQTFSVQITGGTPGDSVSFRVREVRAQSYIFGTSFVPPVIGAYSEIASTTAPLSAPTTVVVTRPDPNYCLITWADVNTLATGFRVYRSITYQGGQPTPYDLVGFVADPAARAYKDVVQSAAGYSFSYKVLAYNATTTSPMSTAGSFGFKFNAPGVSVAQTLRRRLTLTISAPVGYSFTAGDQVRISRSLNNGPSTTLTNVPASFPIVYNDDAVDIGDKGSYTAQVFSATESGPVSEPRAKTVYDIVLPALGTVNQIRISGSRTTLGAQGIFAACNGGILKITTNPLNGEPLITTQTNAQVLNAKSLVSGDLARIVAFTGTAPGNGNMVLMDAGNLNIIAVNPMIFQFTAGLIVGYPWRTVEVAYDPLVSTAQYAGGTDAAYLGWVKADERTLPNPFTGASYYARWYGNLGSATQEEVLEFSSIAPTPMRYESIGGYLFYFVYDASTDSSIPTRSDRNSLQPTTFSPIRGRVIDLVTDNISKVYALMDNGLIALIDFSLGPNLPGIGLIGQIALRNGASFFSQGAIELASGARLLVAVAYADGSDIVSFAVPPKVSVSTPLTLAKSWTVDEMVNGLAFDGGQYFYANSSSSTRLFRIDIGF